MNDTSSTAAMPGFLAFVAFTFLALALWFLMRNMNARMRRMSYRQQRAHRGRDEPQAGPGEISQSEDAGPPSGPDPDGGPQGAGPGRSGD